MAERVCLVCGNALKGRQERFCSQKCYNKWYYNNCEKYRLWLRKYQKAYYQKPEVRERMIKYQREYYKKPEVKKKIKEYYQRPEVRERRRAYLREYYKRRLKEWKRQKKAEFLRENVFNFDFITNGGLNLKEWKLVKRQTINNKIIYFYRNKNTMEKKKQIIDVANRREIWDVWEK